MAHAPTPEEEPRARTEDAPDDARGQAAAQGRSRAWSSRSVQSSAVPVDAALGRDRPRPRDHPLAVRHGPPPALSQPRRVATSRITGTDPTVVMRMVSRASTVARSKRVACTKMFWAVGSAEVTTIASRACPSTPSA